MALISGILRSQNWNINEHDKSKEEYASKLLDAAQAQQLELMLLEHNWKQYCDDLNVEDIIKSKFGAYHIDDNSESNDTQIIELNKLIEKYKCDYHDYIEQTKEHVLNQAEKYRNDANS